MKKYKVIIIGAGASGVMTALTAKCNSVALIDLNYFPAKKLLATGNGKCNLTNTNLSSKFYNVNIDEYLKKFNVKNTLSFFETLGFIWYEDEEHRVYPYSNSAKSVVDIINNALTNKLDLFMEQEVLDIKNIENKFIITTNKETFECEKLVISTGGKSIEKCLNNLKISYSPFVPSLVALKCNSSKNLNGIRLSNVLVTATNNLNENKSEMGEVLFKENGLSGIVIFNLSTLFSRTNNFNGSISIDLMPNLNEQELKQILIKRQSLNLPMSKYFTGMFQNAISDEILKQAKINSTINSLSLTSENILILTKVIKNLKFIVSNHLNNNQVFSGGINLNNLTLNLESKQIPNLYFTGEICNVDGECGGYNLQWAWTSGHIVGETL